MQSTQTHIPLHICRQTEKVEMIDCPLCDGEHENNSMCQMDLNF
jgi:hypothetical protein